MPAAASCSGSCGWLSAAGVIKLIREGSTGISASIVEEFLTSTPSASSLV